MKAYTDLEQSRKLAEILPLESADMCYIEHSELINIHVPFYKKMDKGDIPCWSLAALINALPPIEGFRPIIDLDINLIRYEGNYRDKLCFSGNNIVDACYEMILKLKEQNLL